MKIFKCAWEEFVKPAAPPSHLVPARLPSLPSPPLSHIVLKHMQTSVLSPQFSEHRYPKELFCFPARIATMIVTVMSSPPPNVSASPTCFLRGWYNQDPNGAHSCSRSARQSHPSAPIRTCRRSPLVYRGLAAAPWVHQPLAGHALLLGGRRPSRAEPSRAGRLLTTGDPSSSGLDLFPHLVGSKCWQVYLPSGQSCSCVASSGHAALTPSGFPIHIFSLVVSHLAGQSRFP